MCVTTVKLFSLFYANGSAQTSIIAADKYHCTFLLLSRTCLFEEQAFLNLIASLPGTVRLKSTNIFGTSSLTTTATHVSIQKCRRKQPSSKNAPIYCHKHFLANTDLLWPSQRESG
ncbi:hypothetical protein CEXT_515871 [Caerostris extrusa]|uniref:Uncharacterized protein n=1 Tax=Caerostris extrusa TaxID=172846 RepID=A0AAV4UU74_CAEEX|nr:hypothetical protein CEXT_515871 [Caerostris extrusa]